MNAVAERDRQVIEPKKMKSLLKLLETWEPSNETLPDVDRDLPGLDGTEMPDSSAIIKMAREGLPVSAINGLAKAFQVPKAEIYLLLHISPKTGQRAEGKKLSKGKSGQLIQIVEVLWKADRFFKDHSKTTRWLKSPCYALGNQVPIHLLSTIEGISLVKKRLAVWSMGFFADCRSIASLLISSQGHIIAKS